MAEPTEPEPNQDRFVSKTATEDATAHLDGADPIDRGDLARGSETAIRAGSRHRE